MQHIKLLKVLLIILLLSLHSFSFAQTQKTEVRIGLIFPLSGPMSDFGKDMSNSIPLLEQQFNNSQNKYSFKLLLEDGKFGQSNAAITAAKKLVSIEKVSFIATGSSGETLQVAPYAEAEHILCVAGFASHPDLKNAGDYIFRTYVDAGKGISLLIKELIGKDIRQVGIISEQSSFTLAIERELTAGLGARVAFSEEFALGDSDFNALITKIRSQKPEILYLNIASPKNFITLMQKLKAYDVKVPVYTYYVPSQKEVQLTLGKDLTGVRYLDFPETLVASKDFIKFHELYTEKFGAVQNDFNFRTNYNAVNVIFDAILKAGTNPEKVKEYLYTYDKLSATGKLKFDKNGDVQDLNLVLKTYTN